MSRRCCADKRAFTLIELLIVISVIAILASILFPVFAAARDKARQATCASNLRQLGLAFFQYSGDNDDRYPLPGSSDQYDMSQAGPYWDLADPLDGGPINAYIKERSSDLKPGSSIWFCPSLPGYHETTITPVGSTVSFKQVTARTYTMNWFLRDPSLGPGGTLTTAEAAYPDTDPATAHGLYMQIGAFGNPLTLSRLIAPSDTILLFEGVQVHGATYLGSSRRSGDFSFQKGYMPDIYVAENILTNASDGSTPWHRGFNEDLFCDGHVKAMFVLPYPWVPTLQENHWYVALDR